MPGRGCYGFNHAQPLLPATSIQLISISLSLELIFLSGPYTILEAACLFKLMNGCDDRCCIFKYTKSVANNIKAAAGWQYEHTFQRGRHLVNVCENQELRGKCLC